MIVLLLIASLVVPYLPLYHSTLPHPEWNIPCGADLLLPYIVNMVYRNLKADKIRKRISHYFGLQPIVLESWITSLTLLRKACYQVGSCMDFVFTYTKVYFLATHLRNTLLCQSFFFIQIILTLLNCLSWHKHFAHGQAHKALNVNQYPSTKIKSEFSGIH